MRVSSRPSLSFFALALLGLMLGAAPRSAASGPLAAAVDQRPEPPCSTATALDRQIEDRLQSGRAGGKATARLYLRLLGRAGSGETCEALVRHLAQLVPLLGPSTTKQVLANPEAAPNEWTPNPKAGAVLQRWWRQQDPNPSTPFNERLAVHLRRVSYAVDAYASDRSAAGFDDRGTVYVRYGEPYRTGSVPYQDMGFISEVIRPGVNVSLGDFPDHEIWTYDHISSEGRYIFVQRVADYEIATAPDLLPPELRRGFNGSARSQNRAYSTIHALQHIYSYLSRLYGRSGDIYADLNKYVSTQDMLGSVDDLRRRRGRSGGSGSVGYGSGSRQVHSRPGAGSRTPSMVAKDVVSKSQVRGHEIARVRQQEMPSQYGGGDSLSTLPVAFRTFRRLTPAGETTTNVYWALREASTELPENADVDGSEDDAADADTSFTHYHVAVSATRYDDQFRRLTTQRDQALTQRRRRPANAEAGRTRVSTVHSLTTDPVASTSYLTLQWDQHAATYSQATQDTTVGTTIRRRVAEPEKIVPLRADPSSLEMSDLQVLTVQRPLSSSASLLDQATLYPYRQVPRDASLILRFDLYHLTRRDDGRARWSVEYETKQTVRKGFFGRLFGSDTTVRRTATSTLASGTTDPPSEVIEIDLDRRNLSPGELHITVRATDRISGTTVERSVDFTVTEPSD
jgi:GWxTD domain-containing protein